LARQEEKEGQGSVMGEDSLLERVTAAAEERQLSHNSLLAYRRTWLKIIAWAAAEGLVLETFPAERVGEFYEEATRGRSASHTSNAMAVLFRTTASVTVTVREISTGFVESAINQVVSKRMAKKQQMQWTQRGAHFLLQVRNRVLNEELGGRLPPLVSRFPSTTINESCRVTPGNLPLSIYQITATQLARSHLHAVTNLAIELDEAGDL